MTVVDPAHHEVDRAVRVRFWAGARAAAGVEEVVVTAGRVSEVTAAASRIAPGVAAILPLCSLLVDGHRVGPDDDAPPARSWRSCRRSPVGDAIMTAVSESSDAPTESSGSSQPPTRAARRVARDADRPLPAATTVRRPLVVVATVALSALTALTAYADPVLLAGAVALTGLALAWGWLDLLGAPSPTVPRILVAVVAAAGPAVIAATPSDPYLRNLPIVVGGGLLLFLAHQLFRRDGRPRLTEAVSTDTAALAILTCGATAVSLGRVTGGVDALACASAGVAAASLADLLVDRPRLRPWLLPLAMLLGGWAAALASLAAGSPRIGQAVLLGFLVGAVSHAMRRVLATLPAIAGTRGQLASAAASLLLNGVVVLVFTRTLLGG